MMYTMRMSTICNFSLENDAVVVMPNSQSEVCNSFLHMHQLSLSLKVLSCRKISKETMLRSACMGHFPYWLHLPGVVLPASSLHCNIYSRRISNSPSSLSSFATKNQLAVVVDCWLWLQFTRISWSVVQNLSSAHTDWIGERLKIRGTKSGFEHLWSLTSFCHM